MKNSSKKGQLIVGILIVGLGLLLAVERFWAFEIDGLYHLWPLIIVSIGFVRLIGGESPKQRGSGLFMIMLGSWFLINTLELFGLDWGDSWPVLLMLIGLQQLALPDTECKRSGGVVLILVGIWCFSNVHRLWGLHWGNSWSIGLIIVGLFFVWRALFEARPSRRENADG